MIHPSDLDPWKSLRWRYRLRHHAVWRAMGGAMVVSIVAGLIAACALFGAYQWM